MSGASLTFLFLDESMDESLDLASLTGLLVPLHTYCAVRDAICHLVWNVLAPTSNTVPPPIELHARKLLPELDHLPKERADSARLHVLRMAAKIVNEYGLRVHRVCYTNRAEIAERLKGDPKLYGLNFIGIQSGLQDLMETTLLLPVMDGVPGTTKGKKAPSIDPTLIRAFAATVRWMHHARQSDAVSGLLSIKNSHNLAEPVFGDSTHSTLLQLVDLVSYLLLQRDRAELMPNRDVSEFKAAVLEIGYELEAKMLTLWRGKMSLLG